MKLSSIIIKAFLSLVIIISISCELFTNETSVFNIYYNENTSTSGIVPIDDNEYEKGESIKVEGNSGELTKTDYSFEGWNTAADGAGTSYLEDSDIKISDSDITLYAEWTVIPTYTVEFDSNSGSDIDSLTIMKGYTITKPTDPTRTDFTFTNWYLDSDFAALWDFDNDVVTSDITLYAEWAGGPTYTITYEIEGSIYSVTDSLDYETGDIALIKAKGYHTKVDHYFRYWNTESDGSGVSYSDGVELIIGSEDIYLYAIWRLTTQTYGNFTYRESLERLILLSYDGEDSGSVEIPSEINGIAVTHIGLSAFRYFSGLTSITIPDSVTSIGSFAFNGCSGLASLSIPDSVTHIGGSAFSDCSSLASVTIPDSVIFIGDGAFRDCSSLASVTIPVSVISIGDFAFYGCSSLTNLVVPQSVTSIGSSTFSYCTGLTSVTIPDGITSIGDFAFVFCSNLTSLNIPDSVTSIGQSAFSSCSGLTSLDIPDSVAFIGSSAFRSCSGLPTITILDSITSIVDFEFMDCSSLTSLTIPAGVTTIGDYAFHGCSDITNLYMNPLSAPTIDSDKVGVFSDVTLHIKSDATGYDVAPWTDTSIFSSIVADL